MTESIDWDVDFEEFSDSTQNNEQIEFARKRFGGLGASQIHAICTYQPDTAQLPKLESELSSYLQRLEEKSCLGFWEADFKSDDIEMELKAKGAITIYRNAESTQKKIDAINTDSLPDGALELAEKIALERLTGFCEESDVSFDTPATRWGNKYEAEAIEALKAEYPEYDFLFTGEEQKSFQLLDYQHEWATPDAVASIAGYRAATVDSKCPYNRRVHFRNWRLITGRESFKKMHPVYYWQGVDQMLATELKAFWFVSYDPRCIDTKIPALVVHKFELYQPDADFLLSRVAMFEDEVARIMEC